MYSTVYSIRARYSTWYSKVYFSAAQLLLDAHSLSVDVRGPIAEWKIIPLEPGVKAAVPSYIHYQIRTGSIIR